jgi:KaiC/GvpD/RAD55 family RecA-like ATPase
MNSKRLAFEIEKLDGELDGGLLPGSLTVIAGATGVGKTQLGLHWANAGAQKEGHRGILCDLTSRGDSQNHRAYAERLFGWQPGDFPLTPTTDFDRVWDFSQSIGDHFRPFERTGRRVTRSDVDAEQWHEWKSDLSRVLRCAAGYFYQHFARGARRVVFDGIEPVERFSESIQFEFFEYVYHRIIREDDEWAAREWLREAYRAHADSVASHRYDRQAIGCVYLYTTRHVMLDDLLTQPIEEGDIFANANTIILMGRTRHDGRMGRALAIPKHRGSACGESILPYRITEHGIVFE